MPTLDDAQDFQPLGFSSLVTGISADGSVVVGGTFNHTAVSQAFRWSSSTGMVSLGSLPGASSSGAFGVNADGSVVVGRVAYGPNGDGEAFRWTVATGMVGLNSLGGNVSDANGVNADGSVVVGQASDINGTGQAYRWTAATGMVGLSFPPGDPFPPTNFYTATGVSGDGSVVVGTSANQQAVLWTVAAGVKGLGFLASASFSAAYGVSADGSAVVGVSGMVGLGFLPGTSLSYGLAVNSEGSVVVGYGGATFGNTEATRWTATTGMQSISDMLASVNVSLTGWTLAGAYGVSADGTAIVGESTDHSGQTEGWIARIPVNAFALLDLQGLDHSIGSLVWGGTVINSGIANPATLTAGGDNTSTTFSGIIQDGASTTALIKSGAGTLTLTGINTYTGGTTLKGGTLDLSASGAAGAGPIIFDTGIEVLRIENAALSSNTFGNTIDSFGESDVIDLPGLVFVTGATAIFNAGTHTLTVTSNGITDTVTLTNLRGTVVKAISDGASGTEIVLIPAATESLVSDTGSSSTDKIT